MGDLLLDVTRIVEERQRAHHFAIAVQRQRIDMDGNFLFRIQGRILIRGQKFAHPGV